MGKYELLELIPGYDHVEERQAQIINVKVHHIRKKLGEDVIENVRGFGYRLSQRQHDFMRGEEGAGALRNAPMRSQLIGDERVAA